MKINSNNPASVNRGEQPASTGRNLIGSAEKLNKISGNILFPKEIPINKQTIPVSRSSFSKVESRTSKVRSDINSVTGSVRAAILKVKQAISSFARGPVKDLGNRVREKLNGIVSIVRSLSSALYRKEDKVARAAGAPQGVPPDDEFGEVDDVLAKAKKMEGAAVNEGKRESTVSVSQHSLTVEENKEIDEAWDKSEIDGGAVPVPLSDETDSFFLGLTLGEDVRNSNGDVVASKGNSITPQMMAKFRESQIDNIQLTRPNAMEISAAGLSQKHQVTCGEAKYTFSDPITYNGRPVVLATVTIEGKSYLRMFYRSQSQGNWRVMHGLLPGGHIAKGRKEHDTCLPFSVNQAISRAMGKTNPPEKENRLVHGLALQIARPQFRPAFIAAHIWRKIGASPTRTYLANINEKKADFASIENQPKFDSEAILTEKVYLPLYGEVTSRIIPSNNNEMNYLFYQTDRGEVWLGGIELNGDGGAITKYGIRAFSPDSPKELLSPLFEYAGQAGKPYIDPDKNDDRFDSWRTLEADTNYIYNWGAVRELPIIQNYMKNYGLTS